MRACSLLITLITALALFGCSGKKLEAKAPETDPWADYKGTYAAGAPAPEKASSKSEKTDTAKSADTAEVDAKPTKKTAGGKPKKGAAPSEPKTAAADSSAPAADPSAMYNETSAKPDDASTDSASTKKIAKKRAGGGKKAGGKKKPKT